MKKTNTSPEQQLDPQNTEYVEELYEQFLADSSAVPPAWGRYFASFARTNGSGSHTSRHPRFPRASIFNPPPSAESIRQTQHAAQMLQQQADRLVNEYRCRGHLAANLDPLGLAQRKIPTLDPQAFGLTDAESDQPILMVDADRQPHYQRLGDVVSRMNRIYCGTIGYEFMHIDNPQMRDWIQQRIEQSDLGEPLPRDLQLRIFTRLTEAAVFEEFVRKKFVGAKTFSLEGAETLIPLLDMVLASAARDGVREVVVGMAHRGRLNVLENIVGKHAVDIFREFEDQHPEWWKGRGDVKYHLGFSGDWQQGEDGPVHVSLCFNPSHLEYVNPVALGRMRARQDRVGDHDRRHGMVVLIHGDAAFAGEGIVQESLNLCSLDAYQVGGTVHVIVNNQLGFTTPPKQGRSAVYASDVAKMLQVPIFHVNAEFPGDVIRIAELAMEFRREFHRDVVIDMYCYRRWGHNEADEPSFTQPLMYQAISHRRSIRDSYLDRLLEAKQIRGEEAQAIVAENKNLLKQQFDEAQNPTALAESSLPPHLWQSYPGGSEPEDEVETGVSVDRLQNLLDSLTRVPTGFHVHKKLQKSIDRRREMARGERPLDWSTAEALAFASLATEGHPVRLTGQDSARGTFSQRHAVLHDVVDGTRHEIFQHLSQDQQPIEVCNSPLCEAAALGFEYGYSMDYPEVLVLWEAQYGDFANAAQVIIDQFIASAEDKWRRLSGLVLLLPHAFEGMGPEHSSARIERFLLLAAEDNMQIVCPSTPAQYFHCLRRQVKCKWRKPLVVFTPKSLLRHPLMASSLEDCSSGSFQRILPDNRNQAAKTQCVLLSSGKASFDLATYRDEQQRADFAILRVEQFYPLRDEVLAEALRGYEDGTPVRWVQEEPENMGAASYWKARFCDHLLGRFPFSVVARPASASPATGSSAAHHEEQRELAESAFAPAE